MSSHPPQEVKYPEDAPVSEVDRFNVVFSDFVSGLKRVLTPAAMKDLDMFKSEPLNGSVKSREIQEDEDCYPVGEFSGYIAFIKSAYLKLGPIVAILAGSLLSHRKKETLPDIVASEAQMLASARTLFFSRRSLKYLFKYIVNRNVKHNMTGEMETAKGVDCLINETALLHLIELVLQEILTKQKKYHSDLSESEPDSPVAVGARIQLSHLSEMQTSLNNLRLLNLFRYSHNLRVDHSEESKPLLSAVSAFAQKPNLLNFESMHTAYNERTQRLEKFKQAVIVEVEATKTQYNSLREEISKITEGSVQTEAAWNELADLEVNLSFLREKQEQLAQLSEELSLQIVNVATTVFADLMYSGIIIFLVLSGVVDPSLARLLNTFLHRLMEKPSEAFSEAREWYFASMYSLLVSREVGSEEFIKAESYLKDIVLEGAESSIPVNDSHKSKSCRRGAATAFLRLVVDSMGESRFSDKLMRKCIGLLVGNANIKFSIIGATVLKELQGVIGYEECNRLWPVTSPGPRNFDEFLARVLGHAAKVPVTSVPDVFAHPVAVFLRLNTPPTSSPVHRPATPVATVPGLSLPASVPAFRFAGSFAARSCSLSPREDPTRYNGTYEPPNFVAESDLLERRDGSESSSSLVSSHA